MNTNAFAAASSGERLVIENEPRFEFDVYADVQRRTGVFVRLQFLVNEATMSFYG